MPNLNTESFEKSILKYVTNVRIGSSYKTYRESIEHSNSDELFDPNNHTAVMDAVAKEGIFDTLSEIIGKHKRRDTSLGGNDAINCYYSFNENDDIIHPITAIVSDAEYNCTKGLGRVYDEMFDSQQQIVWMSFGVPIYSDLKTFYSDIIDKDLAMLQNTGDVSIIKTIFRIGTQVALTIAFLPIMAIKWTLGLLTKPSIIAPSKYYDFKATMPLYYKTVNTMLAHIAVNMNLISMEDLDGKIPVEDPQGIPELIKKHGLDILTILDKRRIYDKLSTSSPATDDELNKLRSLDRDKWKDVKTAFQNFVNGFISGVTEAKTYVGFRMEKSTDSSESASNTTGESELSSMINSRVEKSRNLKFMAMNGNVSNGVIGSMMSTLTSMLSGLASGVSDIINMSGPTEILKGSGFVDIPEVWKSSSFSKNYSFNFQLRSPHGDPVSIFYSIYVPLVMLIAGAFPRAVGANSYTSPFMVRAYSKGMVSIPLGMIDSISIRRGSSEYGWNKNVFPTCIDVSISIKDLSPLMYVAISDGSQSAWQQMFGQNSSFQEYLLTLSGVDVADRVLFTHRMKKRFKTMLKITANNKLNPMMWGFSLANTDVGRAITNFWPTSNLPGIKK